MYSIIIHSDNEADIKLLIKIAKRLNAKVERLPKKYENPSPSNDPYFDNPKNIEKIQIAIEQCKQGKTIPLTPELEKKLFGE